MESLFLYGGKCSVQEFLQNWTKVIEYLTNDLQIEAHSIMGNYITDYKEEIPDKPPSKFEWIRAISKDYDILFRYDVNVVYWRIMSNTSIIKSFPLHCEELDSKEMKFNTEDIEDAEYENVISPKDHIQTIKVKLYYENANLQFVRLMEII